MLGLKNHSFIITESHCSNGLYRLVCDLEDNDVGYSVPNDYDSIELTPRNYFDHIDTIHKHLANGELEELYRNGIRINRPAPIMIGSFIEFGTFLIDSFGNWTIESGAMKGNLSEGLKNSLGASRKLYTELANGYRQLFTWGYIDNTAVSNILNKRAKGIRQLILAIYSTVKVKFTENQQDTVESFSDKYDGLYPKCILTEDYDGFGAWITPSKYELSIGSFPKNELVFEDIEPEYFSKSKLICGETEGSRKCLIFEGYKFCVVLGRNEIRFRRCSIENEQLSTIPDNILYSNERFIFGKDIKRMGDEDKQELSNIWEILVKRGFIIPNQVRLRYNNNNDYLLDIFEALEGLSYYVY